MTEAGAADALTDDAFLGGALQIRQPAQGFRSGLDAVLLAAAVPAKAGVYALEAGAGAGVASLCLARRVPGLSVLGLERDLALAGLAQDNAARNGLGDRVSIMAGTLEAPPQALLGRPFDHVFANPPFLEEGESMAAPDPMRRAARQGPEGVLNLFVDFCLARVASGGSVTLIHRADRLDRILAALDGRAGAIKIFPLWPRQGEPAKRVLVSARKGSRAPLRLLSGLVLHGEGHGFTPKADQVLRGGAALRLD
jgi:tRNA1(Val) A37 N6-methylase TrmN6